MTARLDFYTIAPEAIKAMLNVESYVNKCGLEHSLLHLIKLRVSQINQCAFCVDMHAADARKSGESERRLFAISAWRETPFFTARERAALAWAEAVTLLSVTHAPDDVYQEVLQHFNEKETIDLTMAIATINSWNRLAVSFRKQPTR